MRVKSINISFSTVQPVYASALAVLDVGGIDVPVAIPLKQGDGAPNGHAQIEAFFREAADAVATATAEMARRLKDE